MPTKLLALTALTITFFASNLEAKPVDQKYSAPEKQAAAKVETKDIKDENLSDIMPAAGTATEAQKEIGKRQFKLQ